MGITNNPSEKIHHEKSVTPKWLRRLEKESWQAELLISGVALFSCLQLPYVIYELANIMIDYLPIEQSFFGYMICYANLLAIGLLTAFFFFHFVLRAYWIGMIGMNSVYPKGYNVEDGLYSPLHARRWVKLFPTVKTSIQEIDKMASSQFANAFVFAMMYGMLSLTLLMGLVVYNLTKDYVPVWIFQMMIWGVCILMIVGIIVGIAVVNKRFRFDDRVQKPYYYISFVISYLMTSFLFKPVNQIMFTFTNNTKSSKSFLSVIPFFVVGLVISLYHMDRSNIRILTHKYNYGKMVFSENRIYNDFYLDSYNDNKRIFNPVIESEILKEDYLKLFIPILRNEKFICDELVGTFNDDDALSKLENLENERKFEFNCYKNYHQILINNTTFTGSVYLHYHSIGGRKGLMAYVSKDYIQTDENIIEIIKRKADGTAYQSFEFPFFYAGE